MPYEVTIGIPVYKAADYIEQTMESALIQSYPNIEFLIIDDYGGDESIRFIEHLQSEHPRGKDIRILYNDRNYGVGLTRNRIIDEAQGYIWQKGSRPATALRNYLLLCVIYSLSPTGRILTVLTCLSRR